MTNRTWSGAKPPIAGRWSKFFARYPILTLNVPALCIPQTVKAIWRYVSCTNQHSGTCQLCRAGNGNTHRRNDRWIHLANKSHSLFEVSLNKHTPDWKVLLLWLEENLPAVDFQDGIDGLRKVHMRFAPPLRSFTCGLLCSSNGLLDDGPFSFFQKEWLPLSSSLPASPDPYLFQ